MTRTLRILKAGPSMTVQDRGRAGYLAFGLSRGGAADTLALEEGAALLGQDNGTAAIEMAGTGGVFQASEDIRVALTGAPMRADIEGTSLAWNASHTLPAGAKLTIGAAVAGVYGYFHIGGGVASPEIMGSRSTHLTAGIGRTLQDGDSLPLGPDAGGRIGLTIDSEARFSGGAVRVVKSLQTAVFAKDEISRFEASSMTRDARGNRMGVRLTPDGDGFHTDAGLKILSEVIVPGDIQVTGDGSPFVLLSECQTTGGYPRIGSVLPADLPRVAQARPGAVLKFRFIDLDEAGLLERKERDRRAKLGQMLRPLIRDPRTIRDLLSFQLISGATAGEDLEIVSAVDGDPLH